MGGVWGVLGSNHFPCILLFLSKPLSLNIWLLFNFHSTVDNNEPTGLVVRFQLIFDIVFESLYA